jgi:putative Holliday junction resolvase
MARVLGVDLGSVRVGLAVSDADGLIAQPLDVVPRADALTNIAARVIDLGVGEVVVGIPYRMDGTQGPEANAANEFMKTLQNELDVPVSHFDERLTTKEAERAMRVGGVRAKKQRGVVDKVAAALILQAFLDSRRPR